jgi:hypothetical protein
MLRWFAIDRNGELSHRHRAGLRRAHIVLAEAGDGNRDGFVEALRVYVDAMENPFGIGEGDPAS